MREDALGHDYQQVAEDSPACTSCGHTAGEVCTRCGDIECGCEEIAATGHNWGAWTVIKAATTTSTGVEQRVCKNDPSHVETRTIAKPPSNNISSGSKGSGKGTSSPKASTQKYKNEWIKGKWYGADGMSNYAGTLSWKSNSSGWWVEDSKGWYPTDSWQKIDGTWYYFKPNGYMASSEYYDGYWFNSDGSWDSKYYLSWKSNSTGWWVEDKSGWWPANKWLKIDGDWYYFNGSGYMATSTYVDGYWIGADGVCR